MTITTFSAIKSKLPLGVSKPISSQDVHDVVDTTQSVVSALSSGGPAFIHGTIDLSNYPGVLTGVLNGNTQQTELLANGAALQAAFDEAASQAKYVEAPGGPYCYRAARVDPTYSVNMGLQIPPGVPGVHGNFHDANASFFIQFETNHPALTFGSGNGDIKTTGAEYRGLSTSYGPGLTLGTGSRGFLVGAMFQCKFDRLKFDKFGGGGLVYPYIGWDHVMSGTSWFFSNQVGTLFIDTGQLHIFRMHVNGTGNTFDNVYLGRDEEGGAPVVTGSMIHINSCHQGTFRQLNLEWTPASTLANFTNTRGLLIDSMHIEGCDIVGANPSVIYNEVSSVNLRSVELFDVGIESAKLTGTPSIFSSWGDSQTHVENLEAWFHVNPATDYGFADTRFRVHNPSPQIGQKPNFKIDHIYVQGHTGGLDLDETLPGATYGEVHQVGEYDWNRSRSRTKDASMRAAGSTGNITVYGAHEHSQVVVSNPITAERRVILSNRRAPTGFGSTINCAVGDTREVTRLSSATGAFNLLVMNHNNTTQLASFPVSGANQSVRVIYDGTNWVSA